MTPQAALGANSNSAPSSSLYNNVSSMGTGGQEQESAQTAQPKSEDLVEKATGEFAATLKIVNGLFSSHPGAEEEQKTVMTALANWFKVAMSKINQSGGSSTY